MRSGRDFVERFALVGVIAFVIYFFSYLLMDFVFRIATSGFNPMSVYIYSSSFVNMGIALGFAAIIFLLYWSKDLLKVIASGLIFLGSPIRAIFMINLGSVYVGFRLNLNLVYDLVLIIASIILIKMFAWKVEKFNRGLGFVVLFYAYMFLISLAVIIRDYMVASGSLGLFSLSAYLHYGFYDYLTAFYASALGIIGVLAIYENVKRRMEIEDKMFLLKDLVKYRKYEKAIKLGEGIVDKVEPKSRDDVMALVAYSYYKLGKSDKAYEILKAMDKEYGLLGDVCVSLGKIDEAKKYYKASLEKDPSDYVSMINLGKIYADEGKIDEAERYWREAVKVGKKNPTVWQNLGALELVRGRYDVALEIIREAEKHVKA